jgi:molybdate transport system substrate-binding protein
MTKPGVHSLILALALVPVLGSAPVNAAETHVAVAANFTLPAEEIAAAFHAASGHTAVLSFGATGAFYTQIAQGAPFGVLLAADDIRPARAVAEGLGVPGTVFTYAVGTLVLYSPILDVTNGVAALRAGAFRHLAVADPATAPYGAAAVQVLDALGQMSTLGGRIVTAENVTQALQFIESGNAELGFVALSQVLGRPATQVWRVPTGLHAPIAQDAVLLRSGENDPAAKAFMDFLAGEQASAIIERFGYEVRRP